MNTIDKRLPNSELPWCNQCLSLRKIKMVGNINNCNIKFVSNLFQFYGLWFNPTGTWTLDLWLLRVETSTLTITLLMWFFKNCKSFTKSSIILVMAQKKLFKHIWEICHLRFMYFVWSSSLHKKQPVMKHDKFVLFLRCMYSGTCLRQILNKANSK